MVGCTFIFACTDSTLSLSVVPYLVGCTFIFACTDSSTTLSITSKHVGCTFIFACTDSTCRLRNECTKVGCTFIFACTDSTSLVMNCQSLRKVLPECIECLRLRALHGSNCPIGRILSMIIILLYLYYLLCFLQRCSLHFLFRHTFRMLDFRR